LQEFLQQQACSLALGNCITISIEKAARTSGNHTLKELRRNKQRYDYRPQNRGVLKLVHTCYAEPLPTNLNHVKQLFWKNRSGQALQSGHYTLVVTFASGKYTIKTQAIHNVAHVNIFIAHSCHTENNILHKSVQGNKYQMYCYC
jgi:hypothetical protein